jgi:hypothetical protein
MKSTGVTEREDLCRSGFRIAWDDLGRFRVFHVRELYASCESLLSPDPRHTATTRMGDASPDAFTFEEIFGWSDIRMAMR